MRVRKAWTNYSPNSGPKLWANPWLVALNWTLEFCTIHNKPNSLIFERNLFTVWLIMRPSVLHFLATAPSVERPEL